MKKQCEGCDRLLSQCGMLWPVPEFPNSSHSKRYMLCKRCREYVKAQRGNALQGEKRLSRLLVLIRVQPVSGKGSALRKKVRT